MYKTPVVHVDHSIYLHTSPHEQCEENRQNEIHYRCLFRGAINSISCDTVVKGSVLQGRGGDAAGGLEPSDRVAF